MKPSSSSSRRGAGLRIPRHALIAAALALVSSSAVGSPADPAGDAAAGLEFFESRIRPILVEHCYACHSAGSAKVKADFLLDTREGLLKGGESGKPAVVPGDARSSRLIHAVEWKDPDFQMPPKQKLAPRQIADLAAWVNLGAPDPRTGTAVAGDRAVSSLDLGRDHWAFRPPRDHPAPPVKDAVWPRTATDRFILARLEEKGLGPSPQADRRALIRRAYQDLIGLPPGPDEVDAFVSDPAPDGWEKLIDRLLASPHHGERWGRYWLDLARYSDTKGYVYADREDVNFFHSHVYRDWVIRALNEDMPYDRFLLQQIAADRLLLSAGKTAGIGAGDDRELVSLAAMGFLTVGRRFLGVPYDIIDDRIDVVTRTTQGLTVSCARCHDHKYDPIPTEDYYSLYGVFAASTERTVPLVTSPERTPAHEEYAKGLEERVKKLEETFRKLKDDLVERLRKKAGSYLAAVPEVHKLPEELFYVILDADEINPVVARQWAAYLFQRGKAQFDPIWQPWTELSRLDGSRFDAEAPLVLERLFADGENRLNALVARALAEKRPRSMADLAALYGRLLVDAHAAWKERVKADPGARAIADADQEALRQVLHGDDSPASVPPGSIADTSWFFDEKGKVELGKLQTETDRWINTHPGAVPHALILEDRPGALQNPRVLIRGNPLKKGAEVPRQYLRVIQGEGRRPFQDGSGRLELARAIVDPANPLTARVMVNRVWMHHFGAGLVPTPSNFGTRSEPPSHPELLDHLAVRFMGEMGWSLKKLHREIMTSSTYRQASASRPEADAIDPANRLLHRMNPRRLDFEAMRDSLLSFSGELDRTPGGRPSDMLGARRSVYGKIDRQFLPGMFRAFDFANPDLHIPERAVTTVPQQALFFMNSGFAIGRARALARREDIASAGDPAERIRRLYRLLYQRDPTSRQVEAGARFVEEAAKAPPPPEPPPLLRMWEYGHGEYDPATKTMKSFKPLPHFTGKSWQGGESWPDPELGWVQLTAAGGHAGNDLPHAAVRRWIAPEDGTIGIAGKVAHGHEEGNGVQAYIVHGREGLLASWVLHNRSAEAKIEPVIVKKGDTIDFVVDHRPPSLDSDDFEWAPRIRSIVPDGKEAETWDAKAQFAGPPPRHEPLTPWEMYAQVLLQSNELVFVD